MSKRVELTLKFGESITIGQAKITNLGRNGNRGHKLGFEAPRDVKIDRAELAEKEKDK